MECVGARNFAAMSFPTCASWSRNLMRTKTALPSHYRFISLKVRASGASGESCVAVKEDFANEDDFIKAGPAGLALAAESAKLGLKVGLIGPDLPFSNNYGVWEDEFKDLGFERCVEHVWWETIVYLDDDKPIMIGRAYGRFSRHLLHEEVCRVRCRIISVSPAAICKFQPSSFVTPFKPLMCYSRLVTVASGAASDAMPSDLLKKKLMSRLETMGIRILKVHEEMPFSWIQNIVPKCYCTASMVHLATGYLVVRSLTEAPNYASVIANILKKGQSNGLLTSERNNGNIPMQAWNTLWPQERKRQRAFFLFGLALIVQLDIEGIRTFFRLPSWMWQGFLGSTLSSADLILFAFYMFAIAPNDMRMSLVRHLMSNPTRATMIRTYLTI
ncbi:Lycopene epsilon cyclase [Hibiscus syriacus]|uniref:Lycopene epsilon cyclase n=1 Tax=Hibiscus syriacus TaxID=106335 RepID=A0A6A3BDT6_HIBSY|nr:Lycopene epsilon cyclase [Hibiscus syriacus]